MIGSRNGRAASESRRLFTEHGRRIGPESVRKAVLQVAQEAGLGKVTAHQLRHTLATQAINRGMSLEAIAALLGHKSMRMTMVSAKISNRTVANEYFKVSEQVEALYDAPKELPAEAEGSEMGKLRTETYRRMLGNGSAPDRSVSTATSSRSASPASTASTFRPRSSFAHHSSASATTPPTRDSSHG